MALFLGTQEITPTISQSSIGKYKLLQRVKDDSNNEIGTVSGFFLDENNTVYAVVCLDAKDRLSSSQWCSDNSEAVTDLPILNNQLNSWWYKATDTATSNCNKILAYCSANNYTSSAVSHCRTKSYTINGVVYYGQLPNGRELFDIVINMTAINNVDITASSYSSLNFASIRTMWSSSQNSAANVWYAGYSGTLYTRGKTTDNYFTCPVLEIPNN